MSKWLKFKCPDCGWTVLDEVTTGVTARRELKLIRTNGSSIWGYARTRSPGGFECKTNFECKRCHFVLCVDGVAIDKVKDLVKYLKEKSDD